MQTRAFIRTASIVLLTAICIAVASSDIILPWHPFSTYGLSAAPDGTVTAVDEDAARGGVHVGDQVDIRALSPDERPHIAFVSLAPEGARLRLPMTDGRTVSVTSHLRLRSTADNVSDLCSVIALVGYIIIAAVLVLLRPSPATWAFYAFCYNICLAAVVPFESGPFWLIVALFVLGNVATAVSPIGFVSFAMRFPEDQPKGPALATERALLYGVGPLLIVLNTIPVLLHTFTPVIALPVAVGVVTGLRFGLFALGTAILIGRYVRADREDRNRLQWIVAAFAVAFLPGLTTNVMMTELSIFPPISVLNIVNVWQVLAPIALAFTILKHRLFDIRFVVSRALVFGVMTSLVVGALALVDWLLGRWLAQSRFALVAELALALVLGVFLTTVHRRIEVALNNVIFRTQVLALRALHRFALEVDLIADPKRLVAQTFEALRARVEAEYAAIYTVDGSSFALATPPGGPAPALLPNDDFAVLRLRRWGEPFVCDEPGHPLRSALLLPMAARTQLVGFIVCGPKRDRTLYLPDEIETLATLAHRTGSAYAWLTFRGAATEGFDSLPALGEPT